MTWCRERAHQQGASLYNSALRKGREQRVPYYDQLTHVWHVARFSPAYYAGPEYSQRLAAQSAQLLPASTASSIPVAVASAVSVAADAAQTPLPEPVSTPRQRPFAAVASSARSHDRALHRTIESPRIAANEGGAEEHVASLRSPVPEKDAAERRTRTAHSDARNGAVHASPASAAAAGISSTDGAGALSPDAASLARRKHKRQREPSPPPLAVPAGTRRDGRTPRAVKRPTSASSSTSASPVANVQSPRLRSLMPPPQSAQTCFLCQLPPQRNVELKATMIECVTCHNQWHPLCLMWTPAMCERIKISSWQCGDCKECTVCVAKGDEDKMLCCDWCDRGFHIYCLQPALPEIPADDWLCPSCLPILQSQRSKQAPPRPDPLPPVQAETGTVDGAQVDGSLPQTFVLPDSVPIAASTKPDPQPTPPVTLPPLRSLDGTNSFTSDYWLPSASAHSSHANGTAPLPPNASTRASVQSLLW